MVDAPWQGQVLVINVLQDMDLQATNPAAHVIHIALMHATNQRREPENAMAHVP
jgi:hypothetical protein